MRRAADDVVGKTVAAQIRQAARHLGYEPDDWRVREAWYGRAGAWSAATLDDLRQRFSDWRGRGPAVTVAEPLTLAQRVAVLRQGLADLTRQVDELAAEITMTAEDSR
ncbi:hypothetical protein [Lichenibacterium dinghuense]|uniref:hypothetical protein n=1 Tax=Lichenibacterium dinghuense TaxID=2895977 RepID=UPI001F482909|nr:hypothetical protein [Lichenibacterium sp. 6Y81]